MRAVISIVIYLSTGFGQKTVINHELKMDEGWGLPFIAELKIFDNFSFLSKIMTRFLDGTKFGQTSKTMRFCVTQICILF